LASTIDSFRGEHFFLSNFHVASDGFCLERYYQALKATTKAEYEWVLASPDPRTAKHRGYKVKIRPDWDEQRVEVMRRLLRVKFKRPELAAALLSTGAAELIEGNTWGDTFWGVCRGVGENWLGRLLMELRSELETMLENCGAGSTAGVAS
jgi:ribA/ribD-fused uncharacterized protein